MTGAGRPLRFLVLALGGWIGVRVLLLWPAAQSLPGAIRGIPLAAAAPSALAAAAHGFVPRLPTGRSAAPFQAVPFHAPPFQALPFHAPPRRPVPRRLVADRDEVALALIGPVRFGNAPAGERSGSVSPAPLPPFFPTAAHTGSRWSGSAWAVWRGRATGAVDGGQLGGAQAGVRLAFALDADRHWSVAGRIAAPLRSRGSEAAVGLEWQPGRLPLRLVVERRIPIDAARAGTAIGMVGGINPTRVGRGLVLEGYGQAGVIRRDRAEGYADGALKLSHPLTAGLDIGIGAWGGAQRDAARLDLGPSLGLAIPVERHRLRLSLDWRQRVAGRARPGSGPALTLGADF